MIKDSGERTEFSTGAVRDMKDGKGRMDLLPWYGIMEVSKHCEEGAKKYGEHNVDRGIPLHSLMDSASRHLAKFIAGESDEDHLRAAAWNILWALNQRTTHPELNDMYWAKKDIPKSAEAKETEYAYSCKDPKPRIKLYASVCPECNEVVLLPDSSAHFVTKPLEPIDIYNRAGRKVKLVSKRPDIPSGVYKVVNSGITVLGKDTEYAVEAEMELLDAEYFSEPIHVSYDSRLSEGIEIYALEEE